MSNIKADQPAVSGAGKTIDGAQPTGASPDQQMHGPVSGTMDVEPPKVAPGEVGSIEPVMAAPVDSELPGKSSAATAASELKADAEVRSTFDSKPREFSHVARGAVTIMSPQDRDWRDDKIDGDPAFREAAKAKKPESRISAYAAAAILALFAGAAGGAMATMALSKSGSEPKDVIQAAALAEDKAQREQALGRIESELAALRANLDQTGKTSLSQAARINERIDRVEKVQAEPNAKLAKLSEAVEKLRAASAVAPVAATPVAAQAAAAPSPAAAPAPNASAQANAAPAPAQSIVPKMESRLPTVEGWVLRDVADGGALIESRRGGTYEVYAGDEIRGLGRVDAIRKQDGRWVVVTTKGLIVSR